MLRQSTALNVKLYSVYLCARRKRSRWILLVDILSRIELSKDANVITQLEEVKAAYPNITNFERDFPSLCFALATGVGKTRLMGAFIAYLFLAGRSNHFLVLAPNTTIYEKADFRFHSRFCQICVLGALQN